jgi:mersacidin/lichenicidin family type 2 lantibiotic
MSELSIIRAWKDEGFRRSLGEAERARLPEHPAGLIDLTDAELDLTSGGRQPAPTTNWACTLPTTVCCIYQTHC